MKPISYKKTTDFVKLKLYDRLDQNCSGFYFVNI